MRYLRFTTILAGIFLALTASVYAQADAQKAYQDAKAAYSVGKFEEAWEAAQKAAQTDPQNPEVFLLLGQAQYQLGQLDEALESWKKTLALAPQDVLAAKMIDMLQAQRASVEDRIKFVETMLGEKLYEYVISEAEKCLKEKAISPAARAKLMTLIAEAKIPLGQPVEAQKLLDEVKVLYAPQADGPKISLLTGRAKLAVPETAAEGTAILEKLAAEQPETPLGKTAQYELAAFALGQEVAPAKIETLDKWLAENPRHPRAEEAKRLLIRSNLAYSRRVEKPGAETKLNEYDLKALALATEVLSAAVRADQRIAVAQPILEHFENYAVHGSPAAALAGLETLLKSPLDREIRLKCLRLVAASKNALALKWLEEQARLGKLPNAAPLGDMPDVLKDVYVAQEAIREENPAEPTSQMLLKLAGDVKAYAKPIPWPNKIEQLRGPEAWSISLALTLVHPFQKDPGAVQAAVDFLMKTADELATGPQPKDREDFPLDISQKVVESLSGENPSPIWPKAMQWHCDLLSKWTQRQFQENVRKGNAAANASVTEAQENLLLKLGLLVHENNASAAYARNLLSTTLQPWKNANEWTLVENLQRKLAQSLPPNEQLLAEIDIANLWIEQADRKQKRILQSGFTVPKELDPLYIKALARLYELQADLSEGSLLLPSIRTPWLTVVARYKTLEYYEVAEAAIQVKSEKAVPLADEFAEFQLLALQSEQAQRAFNIFVKQYRAPDKLVLLSEHKNLLDAWKKFIAAHPTGRLAANAVAQIFHLGTLYEQHGAFKVAAGIYVDFAKFAGEQKFLSQKIGDQTTMTERAAFAEAAALDAQARKALAEWAADRKPDAAPPEKLSEEFAAAITAYKKFIEAGGESKLVGEAVNKIAAVALEYANLNAWEVADGVYADLLDSKLKLNHIERLEFARGVCQLGAALPDHARQMLSAISLGGEPRPSENKPGEAMLAYDGNPFTEDYNGPVVADRLSGLGGAPASTRSPAEAPGLQTAPAAGTLSLGAAVAPGDKTTTDLAKDSESDKRDSQLLAMVRQEETARAQRVAQLRENASNRMVQQPLANQQPAPQQGQQVAPPMPALSEAELARQEKALTAAYEIFKTIRMNYPLTPTAEQARGEILVMAAHWRGLSQWQRAASLVTQFLADNAADPQLPQLRLEIARDRLSFAAKPLQKRATRQEMLAEVEQRFAAARTELGQLLTDFPKEKELRQNAQWDIAMSYLTQARTIDAVSPTLAQGQYVRTAKELRQVAAKYADHPRLGEIPTILWNIGQELETRGYNEEAIDVWSELVRFDPLHNLAGEALLRTARTYQINLKRPLRAAEAYLELNFIRGGNDPALQNTIFQIGTDLKNERRWVEALHVLETFVDSFPRHPLAGQALTMAGQIHQTNEAWADAIAAYRRVIAEYAEGQWVQESKWSIAECTINLSQWKEAADAYRAFVQAYPQDGKVPEANRRIDILKDLARYQGLIDEKAERKAFDAQFQIGVIVRTQLNNPVKAIIEYRKVYANWPASYLAGDALFAVGETYLSLGELTKARENLMLVAEKYPTSPSASNAMFLVGKSYEDEADKMGKVTREEQMARSKEVAQRRAYEDVQYNRKANESEGKKKVADLKAAGKALKAEVQEAINSSGQNQFDQATVQMLAQRASQEMETMTALELADRQDKINAALRKAVEAYTATSKIAGGNKADSALLQMATIYDQRLKDSKAAMQTWLEIVRQFSGTNVAEDASWKIAQYYEREGKFTEAVDAYQAFLRNYRRSPNAGAAQFAIAENYEHLGEWVKAMDSYSNYITNFADGPLVNKAKEQINWIKTYRL